MGSVIGGVLIKKGRVKPVIIFNFVAIVATVLSLITNIYVIYIGRFLYGFASGVLVTGAPKVLGETVPSHLLDYGFGSSTNIMINVGVMGCMLVGIAMPATPEELKESSIWMIVFGLGLPFSIAAILLHLIVHKSDGLFFHISRNEKD